MSIAYAVLLALLAGTHAATWGAFKDSPFEGFKVTSFVRTIVVAVGAASLLAAATDLETTLAPIVLIGVPYATERLATELWKVVPARGQPGRVRDSDANRTTGTAG